MLLQIVWLCSVITTIMCLTTDNKGQEHLEYLGISVEPDYIILMPTIPCKMGEKKGFLRKMPTRKTKSNNCKKSNEKETNNTEITQDSGKDKLTPAAPTETPDSVPFLPIARQDRKTNKQLESITFQNVSMNISELIANDLHIPVSNISKVTTHKINMSSILIPPFNLSKVNTADMYNVAIPLINSTGSKAFAIDLTVTNTSATNTSVV